MNKRILLALTLISLAGCTHLAAGPPEIFDESSASTLLAAARPLVFARNRSDVAAHARDYATLVAVEVDRSGDYGEYLLLYRWSTVDRRMAPPPGLDAGQLLLIADDRAIDLKPMDQLPVSLQHRRLLHVPGHGDVIARAYRVDVATLRFVAASRDLSVRMPQESLDTPFALWEDGRAALVQFLGRAAPP